jgi:enoyl-[acyl-carrier-protein] reductase (NADH)
VKKKNKIQDGVDAITSHFTLNRQLVGVGKSPVGVHLAMQLAQTNAKVVMIDRPSNGATPYESIVRKMKENGEMAFFYECEITDKAAVRNVVEAIEKDVGRITMLFHGNLLLDQASDKDLMYSYVHVSRERRASLFEDINFLIVP